MLDTRINTDSNKLAYYGDTYIVRMVIFIQWFLVAAVLMEMFVWWEAPISMRVEWRSALMTSGEQYVMTAGAVLMQLWFAGN